METVKGESKFTLAEALTKWTIKPTMFGKYIKDFEFTNLAKTVKSHPNYIGDSNLLANYGNNLRSTLRKAERIILNEDFIREVVRVASPVSLTEVSDALALARAPFPITWIEWDSKIMLEERVKVGTLDKIGKESPTRLGILIESHANVEDGTIWKWRSFADHGDGLGTGCCRGVVSTELPSNQPGWKWSTLRREPDGTRLNLNDRRMRASILFGNPGDNAQTAKKLIESPLCDHIVLDYDEYIFAMMYSVLITKNNIKLNLQNEYEHEVILEMAGYLRFVLTALALINCVDVEYITKPAAPGKMIASGKVLPYLDHKTVRINISVKTKLVTKYLRKKMGETIRRRAHRVRGHWRRIITKNHPIWVKDHVRGDSTLGWVNQEHEVTTH